jgi:cytoskeletal protein RodZ
MPFRHPLDPVRVLPDEITGQRRKRRNYSEQNGGMTNFEWFLLIVVVIGVPLIVAAVVTIWTIDHARKRKRQNRSDPQVGVKRKAALSPEEVEARKAARQGEAAAATSTPSVSRETLESTPVARDE